MSEPLFGFQAKPAQHGYFFLGREQANGGPGANTFRDSKQRAVAAAYIYEIVGRSKDLIITGGLNVFPAEVEHVLEEHPAVAEAVVVGAPDPVLGESVRAFVLPAASSWPETAPTPEGVSESELIEFCAERLARYKCPSAIVFVRQLPRGVQGKALRRALA